MSPMVERVVDYDLYTAHVFECTTPYLHDSMQRIPQQWRGFHIHTHGMLPDLRLS